jgi:hypothetical protein
VHPHTNPGFSRAPCNILGPLLYLVMPD